MGGTLITGKEYIKNRKYINVHEYKPYVIQNKTKLILAKQNVYTHRTIESGVSNSNIVCMVYVFRFLNFIVR